MKYKPTIGLEIHTELKTKTKMFCSCKNDPDEKRPNVNICPTCTAHPGTLPVPNKEAIKHVLKVGLALGGRIGHLSEFDRKNYFYPDIPKGYQISQYKNPLVLGGELIGVKITRIHLEEDTARSQHGNRDFSFIDFNRAGIPLMELVTEPVINSAEEAVRFGKELQLLVQYLGAAEANMQKGEIRFEANISLSESDKLGKKVEIKNLNSFKALERAIISEIERQSKILNGGEIIKQETRGWDDVKEETFSQRSKENSHDYRYFPDPDITKLDIKKVIGFDTKSLNAELNETPVQKRKRMSQTYGLDGTHIEFYVKEKAFADFFEQSADLLKEKSPKIFQTLSNYIINDVVGLKSMTSIKVFDMANLINMFIAGEISSRGAKEIVAFLAKGEENPQELAKKCGLIQKNDVSMLENIAKEVIANNGAVIKDYQSGKKSVLQFLIGQAVKSSRGSANPVFLKEIFERLLS